MARPTLQDVRELGEWRPPLGVLSVYLGFDPEDRSGAWQTRLRNGLDRAVAATRDVEREQRMAVRATVDRLSERYQNDGVRPPPRGEARFVEVAAKGGAERRWGTGVAPAAPVAVTLSERPVVAPLVELCQRSEPFGVALVSAERVRLLDHTETGLGEIGDWELSVTSLDWRERKSSSASDPARAQGVSASGRDQHSERLEHNRERFLAEAGGLAGERLRKRRLGEVIVFGPSADKEAFARGLSSTPVRLEPAGQLDLISAPTAELEEHAAAAARRLARDRDRSLVERALGEGPSSRPGALGQHEAADALSHGRVERLVLDATMGEPAESLIRAALASGAEIAVVRDEAAERLRPAGGVAATLRY